ncbi:MAG TPA: DUF6355 family natural product biosynthesis protein [Pseudonocardiaceae bacterium]|nr:DUF6355 family natural product biosynthesis protein [Pseudonocardiaceae bacterium]
MSMIRHRVMLVAGAIAAGGALAVGLPAAAHAAPAHSAGHAVLTPASQAAARKFPCGYDGYDWSNGNQPLYNHCGRGDVVIRVHHFFWQKTYDCVAPGVHEIEQGSSQWRIIGAEYDGHTCSIPGSVVGP